MVIKGSELIEQVASINSQYDILKTHFLKFKMLVKEHAAIFSNQEKLVINKSPHENEFHLIFCDRWFSFKLTASLLPNQKLQGRISFSEIHNQQQIPSSLPFSFLVDEFGNAAVEKPEETQQDINITYPRSAVYLTALCLMKAFDTPH